MRSALLTDYQITELCKQGMLDPFVEEQKGRPSYGLGSTGYDLRLGDTFLIHQAHKADCLDPR